MCKDTFLFQRFNCPISCGYTDLQQFYQFLNCDVRIVLNALYNPFFIRLEIYRTICRTICRTIYHTIILVLSKIRMNIKSGRKISSVPS